MGFIGTSMRARRGAGVAASLLLLIGGLLPTTAQAGKPGPSPSACPSPPSDLCSAYLFRGARWAPGPIQYFINPAGAPEGAIQDVQDAFLTWQNEIKSPGVESAYPGDRSAVTFAFGGFTSAGPGTADGINVVVFTNCGQCDAAWVNRRVRRTTINEFEIVVNAARGWQTDLSCPTHDCGALDLQNVLTHEVGHVLDLFHPSDAGAALLTMYPGADPNDLSKRDLGAGDVLGLRKAYPQ